MKFSSRLSFTILLTGLICLILLAFVIYQSSYSLFLKSQLMQTRSIAEEVSSDIDKLLHEKIKTALTIANSPIIKKALKANNFYYANLSVKNREKIIKFQNIQWKSKKNPNDNFIKKFTNNKVSHFFKNQQAILKGEYGEIFLSNKFGALVASSSKLSTFAHGRV